MRFTSTVATWFYKALCLIRNITLTSHILSQYIVPAISKTHMNTLKVNIKYVGDNRTYLQQLSMSRICYEKSSSVPEIDLSIWGKTIVKQRASFVGSVTKIPLLLLSKEIPCIFPQYWLNLYMELSREIIGNWHFHTTRMAMKHITCISYV